MSGTDYEDTPEVRRLLSDLAPRRVRQDELLALHGDRLRESVAGYVQKFGDAADSPIDYEDWVRADIDQVENLSPSEREWLLAEGIHLVRVAIRSDRVTKRDPNLDVIRRR